MITTMLATYLLGVGPTLDPIAGSSVGTEERDLLANGRHLGEVADLWFVEIVSMQNGDGGMASFDPLYVSSHARSWTQNRFLLNGLSITDPARSGLPIFDVPYSAWRELTYRSLWSEEPGFDLRVASRGDQLAAARVAWGDSIGGRTWVPRGFMDREPAFHPATNARRRTLTNAQEADAQLNLSWGDESLRLIVEQVDHTHTYPTLRDLSSGRRADDEARRTTLLALSRVLLGARPFDLTFGWQARARSHDGAQFRHPIEYTENTSATSLIGQARTELTADSGLRLSLAAGLSHRDDREVANSDAPLVADIEREWLWLARPSGPTRLRRTSLEGLALLEGPAAHPFTMRLTANQSFVEQRSRLERMATSYEQGSSDRSTSITLFDAGARGEDWQRAARLSAEVERSLGAVSARALLGLDYAAVGIPAETRLSFVTPAVGVATRLAVGDAEVFVLLRREPDRLGSQVSSFLDPARGNGRRYRWDDDGDQLPEEGETGALLARTGGAYHRIDEALARPTSNQFAFGWRSPKFGVFRAVLTGIFRFHLDALTVRYAGVAADSYQPVSFRDPGGDGRGELRVPGGGQDLRAYERVPGSEGRELYELVNRDRDNRFIGAELQLLSVERRRWFVNLGAAGYWNIGSGAFGSFPDRNDPGIIDESTADPNARISARGRFDQDRSFAVNLMTGWEPIEGLVGSLSLRYRDGQPFTRIVVAELPQGATPIMAVWRGAPRHTFHMVLNTRLRYTLRRGELGAALIGDIYNLLGSGTEILEDPRTGPSFRDAVEMVPGRAGLVALELTF